MERITVVRCRLLSDADRVENDEAAVYDGREEGGEDVGDEQDAFEQHDEHGEHDNHDVVVGDAAEAVISWLILIKATETEYLQLIPWRWHRNRLVIRIRIEDLNGVAIPSMLRPLQP